MNCQPSSKFMVVELQELTDPERPITYGVVKPGPEDPESGVLFVRGGDIANGCIAIENLRTITQDVSRPYARTLLRGGELVISLVGNPGEVAIIPDSLAGANLARQAGLIALRDGVHASYVKYYLMSPAGRGELFQRTQGAVQQVINLADLKKIKVRVPSQGIQQRIAGILSAYDDLIENNRRRIALLEEAARLLYREWFVHFRFPGHEHVKIIDGIPEGWEGKSLGDIITLKRGYDLPDAKRVAGLVPIISSAGITGFHNQSKATGPGVVTGRYGTLGEVYYVEGDYWPLNTALYVTDFKETHPTMALYFLKFLLKGITTEKAAVPGLDRNVLHATKVVWPARKLQFDFVDIASDFLQQLRVLENINQKLADARDLLLPRLMNGEIAV